MTEHESASHQNAEARRYRSHLIDNAPRLELVGEIRRMEAQLRKAEQTATQLKAERDTEAHLVITQRLRADLAERELERLRKDYAEVVAAATERRDNPIPNEAGISAQTRLILALSALSADTQREP